MFALSLLGIVIQDVYGIFIADQTAVFGASAIVITALVLLVAVFLLWTAMKAKKAGWLS